MQYNIVLTPKAKEVDVPLMACRCQQSAVSHWKRRRGSEGATNAGDDGDEVSVWL